MFRTCADQNVRNHALCKNVWVIGVFNQDMKRGNLNKSMSKFLMLLVATATIQDLIV